MSPGGIRITAAAAFLAGAPRLADILCIFRYACESMFGQFCAPVEREREREREREKSKGRERHRCRELTLESDWMRKRERERERERARAFGPLANMRESKRCGELEIQRSRLVSFSTKVKPPPALLLFHSAYKGNGLGARGRLQTKRYKYIEQPAEGLCSQCCSLPLLSIGRLDESASKFATMAVVA